MAAIDDGGISPAELEHVIGFSGNVPYSLHVHPADNNILIYPVGCVVVFSDITDPHKQQLLRGHDEEISALNISPSGRFLASGQKASLHRHFEQVLVWDVETQQMIYHLQGLDGNVSHLCFSHDDRFLAGVGGGEIVVVWDIQTGQPAQSIKCAPQNCHFIAWALPPEDPSAKRSQLAKYLLLSCHSTIVRAHTLQYDVRSMQYIKTTDNLRFPSAGLQRSYTTCIKSGDRRDEMLCGTSAGELVVLNTANSVYRASLPLSTNGLLSLCVCGSAVVSGAGDGTLKRLSGYDQFWSVSAETTISGRVTSLCALPDGQHVIAGTDAGRIYRLDIDTMNAQVISENPAKSCSCVAFGVRSDVFCTIALDGGIRVWDLSDYSVISRACAPAGGSSLLLYQDAEIICGLENGAIHTFCAKKGDQLWHIPRAHKGAVTALALTPALMFTGGADGVIRAWNIKSHQFVSQFSEHTKAVTALVADCVNPNLLHSSSLDKTILTFDLKLERRCNFHSLQEGGICSMTQRYDSEQELITAGTDGLVLFWDCDEQNPVAAFDVGRNLRLNKVKISPSSRFIAVACEDHSIRVWELQTNQLVAIGHGHSQRTTDIAWSPDERQLVSVAEDSCIAVWNFYLGELSAR